MILKAVDKFKSLLKNNKNETDSCLNDYFGQSITYLIKSEQAEHYGEIVDFFRKNDCSRSKIPPLVTQLNVFSDDQGILRVRTKFKTWAANPCGQFPVLLPKSSLLTTLIIRRIHEAGSHAGTYSVLTMLRKHYYIPTVFTVVKKTIKDCVYCKRIHGRTVKLNQSYYRSFRSNAPKIPFRQITIDHFGPYTVKIDDKPKKVWILCISCLWSRAINLKICYDMTVNEFIRNMQLHIFDYGIGEAVYSDSGVQMTSGGNILMDLMKDHKSKQFFEEHGMKTPEFIQYAKGNHALGSLAESAVKLCRKLIGGSIKTNVLSLAELEVVIAQAKYYVNKRPITFKAALRDCAIDTMVPEPITPELLLTGYESVALNIIPEKELIDDDWEPGSNRMDKIRDHYGKLSGIRQRMREAYNEEFLGTLLELSDDMKGRYIPVNHHKLTPGDIVLLKEDFTKAINYPMAMVLKTTENSLGEVTDVEV